MEAGKYHDYKKVAMQAVVESHHRLANDHDVLLVEGAGSPAEINLRAHDIANMGYAEKVDCPVLLVADIDRGGVFAHLVGTLALLSESEQARVKGFIINRFRGDIKLLESGLDWLEQRTGKPVLGVLPYLHDLALDAEDAVALDNNVSQAKVKIYVPLLPHMSNHTDFDPLRLQPNIDLQYIKIGQSLQGADLIIIPGSKNVTSDLTFLKQQGWQKEIEQHLRYGGKLMGICGGYQMLGKDIFDPHHIESQVEQVSGLGLLDFTTTLTQEKTLTQVSGTMVFNGDTCQIQGYEIHCGVSRGSALTRPLLHIESDGLDIKQNIPDGCVSDDKQIIATYLHGFFDCPEPTQAILNWLGIKDLTQPVIDINQHREGQLERLADVCQQHLDMDEIQSIIAQGVDTPSGNKSLID
jgi:adenosylcobyric acid synthase